jgi:type I restriction enzyme S subunit
VVNGYPFDATKFNKESGQPLIRIRDILGSTTDCLYNGEIPEAFWIENQDLLIGMDGDFNSALWAGGRGLLNQRVCKVVPDEAAFSKRLLAYLLPAYLQTVNDHTSSVTVKHLSSRTVQDLPIPAIPRAEQDRIVAALDERLSELDASVANLERAERNLVRYRAAVLAAACSGKLVPTEADLASREGRSYEPADQLLARILAERRKANTKAKYEEPAQPDTNNLPKLPKGWVWATFDQLSPRVTVGWVGPMKDEYIDNGVPFLRSQNVRPGRYEPVGLLYVSPEFHQKITKSKLVPGDLVVVRSGSVGTTCVIPESLAEANCSDLVIIKKPIGLEPQFGAFYMNGIAKWRIKQGQVGMALTHFNTESVSKMPIPVPPLAEQERIVAEVDRHLSRADALAASIAQAKRRAQRLRRAVLAAAFQGRLVPQDPSDEPASVLLDRIRAQAAVAPAKAAPFKRRGRPPGRRASLIASSSPSPTTPKQRGRPPKPRGV